MIPEAGAFCVKSTPDSWPRPEQLKIDSIRAGPTNFILANKFTPKNVLFWPDANSKFVFDSFLVMGLFLLVEEIQNASSDANGHKWFET